MDAAVMIAFLTFAGAVTAGLFKIIDNQNKSQKALVESLDRNTASNTEIAKQTKKGADEAKQRNGHLAEMILQQGDTFKEIAAQATEKIVDTVTNVKQQNVEHQVVKETKTTEQE